MDVKSRPDVFFTSIIPVHIEGVFVNQNWTECMVRPVLQVKNPNNGVGLR